MARVIPLIDVITNDKLSFIGSVVVAASQLSLNKGTGKVGGVIMALDQVGGGFVRHKIGSVPDEDKFNKYNRLAKEKALRLRNYSNHYRSFESLDPDKEQYGGGIRYKAIIVAFSGFAPEIDEAISLAYAIYLHELSMDKNCCGRKFFEKLACEMRQFISHKDPMQNQMIDELATALSKV